MLQETIVSGLAFLLLATLLIPAEVSGLSGFDLTKMKCQGKKYKSMNTIRRLQKRCSHEKGLCFNICLAKETKVLGDGGLKFSDKHLRRIFKEIIPIPGIVDKIVGQSKKCTKKLNRKDVSQNCSGNSQWIKCMGKAWSDECQSVTFKKLVSKKK